jgi:hypothetical protein
MNCLKISLETRKTSKVEFVKFGEHFEFKNLHTTQNTAVKRWWCGVLMQGEREALVRLA